MTTAGSSKTAAMSSDARFYYSRARRVGYLLFVLSLCVLGWLGVVGASSESDFDNPPIEIVLVCVVVVSLIALLRGAFGHVRVDQQGLKIRNPLRTYHVPWRDFEGIGFGNGSGWQMQFGAVLYSRSRSPVSLSAVTGLYPAITGGECKALTRLKLCVARYERAVIEGTQSTGAWLNESDLDISVSGEQAQSRWRRLVTIVKEVLISSI